MSSEESESPQRLGVTRRQLLASGGLVAAAFVAGSTISQFTQSDANDERRAEPVEPVEPVEPARAASDPVDLSDWEAVRARFDASYDTAHMAGMLLASHPQRVREAIESYRQSLDANPVNALNQYRERNENRLNEDAEQWSMAAAGRYFGVDPANVALMGNTTMGLAMVYNGLHIEPDQEVLTGHWNHWATEGSLQYRARKSGFDVRNAVIYDDLQTASEQELVDRLVDQITSATRVVAVTWVHSVSGLKLPVGQMGRRIDEINEERSTDDRIVFCVDGVHGFGVENAVMADLNCDFFISGGHKWLYGPRGTGVVIADPQAWQFATPTIPTFSGHLTPGRQFTPGGFHAFEHRWALNEAFEFHLDIGKARIEQRIHDMTGHLIEDLAQMDHVRLRTPTDSALTAGIVTFEVNGRSTYEVTGHLRHRGIIASTTPETHRIPRLTPTLLNDHSHIERTLTAIRELR